MVRNLYVELLILAKTFYRQDNKYKHSWHVASFLYLCWPLSQPSTGFMKENNSIVVRSRLYQREQRNIVYSFWSQVDGICLLMHSKF